MTPTRLVLILVAAFGIYSSGANIIQRMMNFYSLRSVARVNFFLCDRQEKELIFKTVSSPSSEFLINWNFGDSAMSRINELFETQPNRMGMVFDLACQRSWDILLLMSEKLLLNGSNVVALISQEPKEKTSDSLGALKIQFDSDVTMFASGQIFDVFRTGPDRALTILHCGQEESNDGKIVYSKPPRWNLDGITVSATFVVKQFNFEVDDMEKFLDYKYEPEIDALSRFGVVTHQHLEYLCNFKSNLTTSPDWGYFRPEIGRFDPESMFGWLEDGKVDFGLSLSRLFSRRLTTASYAPVTFLLRTSVIFRHPPAGASYFGFARPFSSSTWLVMGIFIIGASFVLNAITRRTDVADVPPNEPGYARSLLNVLAVISLQGSYIKSLRVPTRVLSVAMHILGLVMYSYYSAEIVGFLLSPSPRTITSVEKLVESRMDMWVENISFHRNHFESKVGASATKYYELGIKRETRDRDKFMDLKIALRKVKKGGVALYGQNAEMYKVIENTFSEQEICSLHSLRMLDLPVSLTVRRNSPYREIYVKAVTRFIESGILDVENRRWHTRRPACIGTESTSPVKLEATFIAQLIFAGGLFLTILVFLVEKTLASKGRKNTKLSVT